MYLRQVYKQVKFTNSLNWELFLAVSVTETWASL